MLHLPLSGVGVGVAAVVVPMDVSPAIKRSDVGVAEMVVEISTDVSPAIKSTILTSYNFPYKFIFI